MLLAPRSDFYAAGHPEPPDVRLLVEVADSSLPYDRRTKLPLYARSGIAEAWLIDLDAGRLEIHRRSRRWPATATSASPRPGEAFAPARLPRSRPDAARSSRLTPDARPAAGAPSISGSPRPFHLAGGRLPTVFDAAAAGG